MPGADFAGKSDPIKCSPDIKVSTAIEAESDHLFSVLIRPSAFPFGNLECPPVRPSHTHIEKLT
jgi:hypothetical protein